MTPPIVTAFDELASMEAKLVDALPAGEGWQFEPKWDGFRALILKAGGKVAIKSKSGKPLHRYFPELVALIAGLEAETLLLDGEILLPLGKTLSFDALQARLHPAPSRIVKLSRETPAQLMLFDCLWVDREDLRSTPLSTRRERLVSAHRKWGGPSVQLSPASTGRQLAETWLERSGGALDGVIAKRLDDPYRPGERAMIKVKQRRTADCVVGGFRRISDGGAVGSLLLGLYNDAGELDHVGFVSGFSSADRAALEETLAPFLGGSGFTGKAPGGPSRWSTDRASQWVPLRPGLVVELLYDQVTGQRFRYGTRFLRWRPDKVPEQCRFDQLIGELRPAEIAQVV